MLYTKISPVGIDISIQKLQIYLHEQLLLKWGITTDKYNCFGRCYRNQVKDEGYVAEVYTGGREYKEVYVDDRVSATSFFGIGETQDFNKVNKTEVHLIFWVNLEQVKPLLHRGDEEVRKDVQKLIDVGPGVFGFQLQGIRLGIENVLREYSGSVDAANVRKFRDMHPFHIFRFDFDLLYNINQC